MKFLEIQSQGVTLEEAEMLCEDLFDDNLYVRDWNFDKYLGSLYITLSFDFDTPQEYMRVAGELLVHKLEKLSNYQRQQIVGTY